MEIRRFEPVLTFLEAHIPHISLSRAFPILASIFLLLDLHSCTEANSIQQSIPLRILQIVKHRPAIHRRLTTAVDSVLFNRCNLWVGYN
ncbi:hypothetical protein SDJN02_22812, partial [Cucurbita argyrosperma subsp. argyrosperma]